MQWRKRCSVTGDALAKSQLVNIMRMAQEGKFGGIKGQKMEQNTPFFHTYAQFAQGYAQQSTGMSTGGHDIIHKTCRQNALESGGGRIVK